MFIKGLHPVMIKSNDELNVWFVSDYFDYASESTYSPSEKICFDVYAYGKTIISTYQFEYTSVT